MSGSHARSWSTAVALRLEPIAFAALSLGAAAIHFGVIAEHYAEWPLFGAFFSLLGWFQALWAIAYVIRPAGWLTLVGIVVNGTTILVWAWAHVVGLPFGPDPGQVEPTTLTDLMATLFELLLVVGLVGFWRTHLLSPRVAPRRSEGTAIAILVLVVLLGIVAVGTTAALAQGPM
jgi:hypothetical protein